MRSTLLALLVVTAGHALADPQVGAPMPAFAGYDLGNKLGSLKGLTAPKDRPPPRAVVVVFFGTWCAPCKEGLPSVLRAAERLKKENVETVIIATKDDAGTLVKYFASQNLKVTVPVVPDPFRDKSEALGVKALPRTIIVDDKRVVRKVFTEESAEFETELVEAVHAVLAG